MDPCNFTTLVGMDRATKLTVFGYIRQCEKLLISKHRSNVIPSLVIHICIWYYHTESFGACSPCISLNYSRDTGDTATYISGGRGTVFGKFCVQMKEAMTYRWKIQIIGKLCNSMDIGLSSSNDPSAIADNFSCGQFNFGSYSSGGHKHNYQSFFGKPYGKGYGSGDLIEMELNTKQRTLSFYKNYSFQGIAFWHIPLDKYYCLAISLGGEQDTVKLIGFDINKHTAGGSTEIERNKIKKDFYRKLKSIYPTYAKKIVYKILKEKTEREVKHMIAQQHIFLDLAAMYQMEFERAKQRDRTRQRYGRRYETGRRYAVIASRNCPPEEC
eukprot:555648_1